LPRCESLLTLTSSFREGCAWSSTVGSIGGRNARRSDRLCILLLTVFLTGREAFGQQRPLETQDAQGIGGGNIRIDTGFAYSRDQLFPLSGLQGNLSQIAVTNITVGVSPIADFQISGGPYNRLVIAGRQPAPLAALVTATGQTTHAVEDLVIGTNIRFVPESSGRPAVGVRFDVRLPNAKHQSGLGQDTTDFGMSLSTAKRFRAVRVVGNLGMTIMSEPLDAAKQNDVVTYGASATGRLSQHLELITEVNGRWSTRHGVAPVGTESRSILRAGARRQIHSVWIDAAMSFGLTSIDPSFGLTTGVTYIFRAFSLPSSSRYSLASADARGPRRTR